MSDRDLTEDDVRFPTLSRAERERARRESDATICVTESPWEVSPGLYAVQCVDRSRHTYDQEVRPGARQERVCGVCGARALFTPFSRVGGV